jgi:hypothetical protein
LDIFVFGPLWIEADGRFSVSGFRIRLLGLARFLLLLNTAFTEKLAITGIPDGLVWRNLLATSHVDGAELTIRCGKETDWFIDPFDNTLHNLRPCSSYAGS